MRFPNRADASLRQKRLQTITTRNQLAALVSLWPRRLKYLHFRNYANSLEFRQSFDGTCGFPRKLSVGCLPLLYPSSAYVRLGALPISRGDLPACIGGVHHDILHGKRLR